MSKWVVDTCVIIDILSGDGDFSAMSADAIDAKRDDGLVITPITYVELAPSFRGDAEEQDSVLSGLGIELDFAGNKDGSSQNLHHSQCAWCRFLIRDAIWYCKHNHRTSITWS